MLLRHAGPMWFALVREASCFEGEVILAATRHSLAVTYLDLPVLVPGCLSRFVRFDPRPFA